MAGEYKSTINITITMPRNMARLAGLGIYLRGYRQWPKESQKWVHEDG